MGRNEQRNELCPQQWESPNSKRAEEHGDFDMRRAEKGKDVVEK